MAKLSAIRALVTRPEPQATALVQAIQEQGGYASAIPMLSICPLPETQAAKDTTLNLDRFDKIIFISRPAAQIGLSYLENYWPQFPPTPSMVCDWPQYCSRNVIVSYSAQTHRAD